MHWRALFVLVLAITGSGLITTTAAADSGNRDPVVDLVVRDCSKDDDLDVDYPLWVLRRALDELPKQVRRHTRCEQVFERAIDRAKRRLDREVSRIWADCGRDEDLDRDYSVRALRRALRLLPDDLRMYTDCEAVIERALERAQRRLRREVERIIRDCERHRRLDRDHSLEALFRALRRVGDDKHCVRAIVHAIEHH
jgi:hypothetical protein